MPKPVVWSPQASDDLFVIAAYLADEWGKETALSFINYVDRLVSQFAHYPKLYPLIHRKKKIRKCVIAKHNSIYYRERKEFIDVLRIYDNRKNPKTLKFNS
jgi:plasmid stabilization system protein ParE